MVPKHINGLNAEFISFRAVLFRMVPKLLKCQILQPLRFRAVLFRMVPKPPYGSEAQFQLF